MKINQAHRNVHIVDLTIGQEQKFLLISDVHWDNPKCDRALLKKHLDKAKKIGAKVIVNGDFFCLMQGKGDPRKSKSDIRPEHNNNRYLDSIVETAVDWFAPYKDVLVLIGYGNHEKSIINHQETDILRRFVDLFNLKHKPTIPIRVGGYGGWVVFKSNRGTSSNTWKLHYYHGSGGGGPVTKNMIQHQRNMAFTDGADGMWMGHVHEMYIGRHTKQTLNALHEPELKDVTFIQTATYKEEFGDRSTGWHVERGGNPKPLGGYWMTITPIRVRKPKDKINFLIGFTATL